MTYGLHRGICALNISSNQLTLFGGSCKSFKLISRKLHRCSKIQPHPFTTSTPKQYFGKYQVTARRCLPSKSGAEATRTNNSFVMYFCATAIFMLGMAYAGVPLYRIFCSVSNDQHLNINYSQLFYKHSFYNGRIDVRR